MTSTDQALWLRVKDRLRAEVGEDIFSSWFARMELGFEASSYEGAVCVFFDDSLTGMRQDLILELCSGLTFAVRGIRLEGNVADVKDRPGAVAPEGE